ncbi:MAG: hypothetical protein HGB30_14780 [Holophagaceae bacterium]|nr:hypothetical protein [Holophagaceae bacterium]
MALSAATLQQRARALAARLLPTPLSPPLRAARTELHRTLSLAFRLAATHRQPVMLEPGGEVTRGRVALQLPPDVHWGCPPATPLPPNLAGSGWLSGFPHPILVMPQRRAVANVWFLHHGREALCLQLGLSGAVALLRFRPRLGTWISC